MNVRKAKPLNSNREVTISQSPDYYKHQVMQAVDLKITSEMDISSPIWVEFARNKKSIISELRTLVVNDPSMKELMKSNDVKGIDGKNEIKAFYHRKWDLFLKYADVWDDDLKNLAYLELKKIYLLTQYDKKKTA